MKQASNSQPIEIKKMIFRIEPRRGAQKIALGTTLGTIIARPQALKGRQKPPNDLSPFQGLGHDPQPTQGCTLGYFLSLRWSFIRKFFYQHLR